MAELADNTSNKPLMMSEISEMQDISRKYLHSILTSLKKAGLVESVRGAKGGFVLTRSPEEITMHDIICAISGKMNIVDCVDPENLCGREKNCRARRVWLKVSESLKDTMKSITLADINDMDMPLDELMDKNG